MSAWTQDMPRYASPNVVQSTDQLLRDVPGVLDRIQQNRGLASLARAMLVTVALGAGLFGAAMGAYRGGLQILFAGIKLPIALLLTTAICAPALTAINSALGRPANLLRDLALVLAVLARMSLVVAAQVPLILLAVRFGVSYHDLILLVVGCCSVAGLVGLTLLLRGLKAQSRQAVWTSVLGLLLVFGSVGAQMSWTLRPFVVRPRTPEAPFIRSVEGSFWESVAVSTRSAQGIYSRRSAPLPLEEP